MTPFRGHIRLTEYMGSFLPINFDSKELEGGSRFKVIASSWRKSDMAIYFGHHVILTIVGTGWDDTPLPKDGQKPVRTASTFFSNLSAIITQLLVKG